MTKEKANIPTTTIRIKVRNQKRLKSLKNQMTQDQHKIITYDDVIELLLRKGDGEALSKV